jgi:hypothetical protein
MSLQLLGLLDRNTNGRPMQIPLFDSDGLLRTLHQHTKASALTKQIADAATILERTYFGALPRFLNTRFNDIAAMPEQTAPAIYGGLNHDDYIIEADGLCCRVHAQGRV